MSDNAFPLDFFKPTMDAALTQTHLKNKSLAHFFFSTSLPKIESASLLLFLYNVFFLLQAKKIENKTTTSTFTSPTLTQLLITASITIILLSQLSTSRNKSSLLSTVISLIYLSFSLRLLSPIIRTLTIAYSEDTVFDLTNSLLTLSFLTSTHPISTVLSRNAALAATTILTSRFSNDETSVDSGSDHNHTAFVYTLLALALVGFYADLRLLCTKNDRLKNIVIVAVIVILTASTMENDARLRLYCFGLTTLGIVVPVWLLYWQQHKRVMVGGWEIVHYAQLQTPVDLDSTNAI